jgi:hypothetical protein
MRILFEHMMDTLAPVDQVIQTSWFQPEREGGKPTRAQRVSFAIHGGLTEQFVRRRLNVDPAPLRKKLLDTVDNLSKQVHGREKTIVVDRDTQAALVDAILNAMDTFLDAVRNCRAAILDPIADALDETAVDVLITDTIQAIDELASHHSIEDVEVVDTGVYKIGATAITYRVTGTVSSVLQWGSNSDVNRGDGLELSESFSFFCDIEVPLDDPWDLSFAETNYFVDTQSWRDGDQMDDWPSAFEP